MIVFPLLFNYNIICNANLYSVVCYYNSSRLHVLCLRLILYVELSGLIFFNFCSVSDQFVKNCGFDLVSVWFYRTTVQFGFVALQLHNRILCVPSVPLCDVCIAGNVAVYKISRSNNEL